MVTSRSNELHGDQFDQRQTGQAIYQLAEKLFPVFRSITGEGVRQSLKIIRDEIPINIHEVPSGTKVFDWTIPKEWNIREAWIKDADGNKIIDLVDHNLHVLNYSIPVSKTASLDELKKHLYTIPDMPDLIPYRTSYYEPNWGFCMTHNQMLSLEEGLYEVFIDSTLTDGALTYGELYIPGLTEEEVIFSTHICHPSLANDNVSGMAMTTFLAKFLLQGSHRYSYRFLFIPATIGSITWLALNEEQTKKIHHGLVISLVGDKGDFTYKKTRKGDHEIDKIVLYSLEHFGANYKILDFFPYGYDDRQFGSPGFSLPVGNLTRSQFGQYPEYHTSADNMDLIRPDCLEVSFRLYQKVVETIEKNLICKNLHPKCEPQLGKRGLYDAIGGRSDQKELQMAMLWVLNLADGQHSLLDVALKSGLAFEQIYEISQILIEKDLLVPV